MAIHTTFFSAVVFISVLLQCLMDFSDIVILCNRPIVAANKTSSVLICL